MTFEITKKYIIVKTNNWVKCSGMLNPNMQSKNLVKYITLILILFCKNIMLNIRLSQAKFEDGVL